MTAITDGSIWWTIEPNREAASYGETLHKPQKVMAWRRSEDQAGLWRLSEFGGIEADFNETRYHTDGDIGQTLFSDEASAWEAFLSSSELPLSIETLIDRLEDQKKQLLEYAAESEAAAAAIRPRYDALNGVIEMLNWMPTRAGADKLPGRSPAQCICQRCSKYDGCPNRGEDEPGYEGICTDCRTNTRHAGFHGIK